VACFRRWFAMTVNPESARRKHAELPANGIPHARTVRALTCPQCRSIPQPEDARRPITLQTISGGQRDWAARFCSRSRASFASRVNCAAGGMLSPLVCNDSGPCIGTAKACGAAGERDPPCKNRESTHLPAVPFHSSTRGCAAAQTISGGQRDWAARFCSRSRACFASRVNFAGANPAASVCRT